MINAINIKNKKYMNYSTDKLFKMFIFSFFFLKFENERQS